MAENKQRREQEHLASKLGQEVHHNAFERSEEWELENSKRIRDENIQLSEFRKQQIKERKLKEQEENDESRKDAEDHFKDLREEEAEFQKYASEIVQCFERQGQNVYPLKKAVKEGIGGGLGPLLKERGGVRPSFQSVGTRTQLIHLNNESSELNKQEVMGTMSTYTRLGFIWSKTA